MRLRDLLKFEFFFEEKDRFRGELRRELSVHGPDWEQLLAAGSDSTQELLRRFRPFTAHRVLRPFLEAYRQTADHHERTDTTAEFDEQRFVDGCMGRGKQYLLQRRIQSAASVSQVLIRTALGLARNRELLRPGNEIAARRTDFADEIRDVIRRIDIVEALALSRRTGLIE
jgi:glycerol-3-phosphate O-acyltransferase